MWGDFYGIRIFSNREIRTRLSVSEHQYVAPNFMLQRQSWLFMADSSNVLWVRIFHIYGRSSRRVSVPNTAVKSSARLITPPQFSYKGFKRKYLLKGSITRNVPIRFVRKVQDVSFFINAGIVLRSRGRFRAKYHYGPIPRYIRRRKFYTLFPRRL